MKLSNEKSISFFFFYRIYLIDFLRKNNYCKDILLTSYRFNLVNIQCFEFILKTIIFILISKFSNYETYNLNLIFKRNTMFDVILRSN